MDPADPQTYQPWPQEWWKTSYSEKLKNTLENNDFSNIPTDQLPAAVPEALQVAKNDPYNLARESLGFAIMSRNSAMVSELLELDTEISKDIDVFHLATSYLDGSRACCDMIYTITCYISLPRHYTNDLGHTVLDNLMIAILKDHSCCAPDQVDDAFKGQSRFAGEEVDICGRWDADSDTIQELLANSIEHIPFQWKHKFCHTSVQVICHVITNVWRAESPPDINTCSGLFVRRCSQPHCGLKMHMTPLRALVLVMLQLASHGCEGEDLFGAVAILLCLLHCGANPSLHSTLSITSLIGRNPSDHCNHESHRCEHEAFDPLQLANAMFYRQNTQWTEKLRLGWRTCCQILQYSQLIWTFRESREPPQSGKEEEEEEEEEDEDAERFLCVGCQKDVRAVYVARDERLGLLWSVMNEDLVTYRRLQVGHPWVSDNILVEDMLATLQRNCEPDLPRVRDTMMKPSCCCVSFKGECHDDCIEPNSACAF